MGAIGPLLALLGFFIVPFIWSISEVLFTAEMGTIFPENGGYVVIDLSNRPCQASSAQF